MPAASRSTRCDEPHDQVAGARAGDRGEGNRQPRSGTGDRAGKGSAKREGVWLRATADRHRPSHARPSGDNWLVAIVLQRRFGIGVLVLSSVFLFGYAVTRLMR